MLIAVIIITAIFIFVPMQIDIEIWRAIINYPNYEVSNLGRIRSKKSNRILRPVDSGKGYLRVKLYNGNGKCTTNSISILVATAFIPNPENKPEVNHKKRNKKDNRACNLEWSTHAENMHHYASTNVSNRKQFAIKFTMHDIHEMYVFLDSGFTLKQVAKLYKVDYDILRTLLQYMHPSY